MRYRRHRRVVELAMRLFHLCTEYLAANVCVFRVDPEMATTDTDCLVSLCHRPLLLPPILAMLANFLILRIRRQRLAVRRR